MSSNSSSGHSSMSSLDDMRLFHYHPVNGAPEAFVGIFLIFTVLFVHRIIKTKSSRWLYILPGTALVELVGYAFRVVCVYNTTLGSYVGMDLLILIAPNALALVNYKTLGVIISLHSRRHQHPPSDDNNDNDTMATIGGDDIEREETKDKIILPSSSQQPSKPRFWLRPTFVTWFFFWSDFFAFVLQGGGGGMQATAKLRDVGDIITLVGLSIQLVFFACFAIIAIYVYRSPRYDYQLDGVAQPKQKVMVCLFATITLLYIRAIYRVAEYATGYDGIIATAEWAFYVFDAAIITSCFLLYYIRFIGNYLP
ncbi:RTA1 like protein-domain-containing protein [Absidia repens]|uniref:RTA1 like protein-domain-containing protein n=1 Tax=Absidia repens TaxID=90262 RepID=A0A1X2I2P5_9FUNG|nr:RTA1 like protein-domain-containing protein [Absidia repens]